MRMQNTNIFYMNNSIFWKENDWDQPTYENEGEIGFSSRCWGGWGSKFNFINFIQEGWGMDDGKITLIFK